MGVIAVTPATLITTVKGLTGPTELRLEPGDYPKVRMSPPAPLIVTSADPENRARFVGGLTLDKPSNLSFVGIDFDISAATAEYADAVRINGGAAIEFMRCGFNGLEREDGQRWGRGLTANGGVLGLTVRNSTFSRLHRGQRLHRHGVRRRESWPSRLGRRAAQSLQGLQARWRRSPGRRTGHDRRWRRGERRRGHLL